MIFKDRADAGRQLASALQHCANRPNVLVLGLPRGGVPVAFEVAAALQTPLDVFVVRKLGAPGHEELAMGAIASGGVVVLNKQVLRALRVADEVLQAAIAQQREELLRRERLYRDHRPPQEIRGRIAILVDDGVATGASMKAAIEGLRQREPAQVVVAVPVASATAEKNLGLLVDDFICLATPEPFFGVGQWYDDFRQLGDDEVRRLLERAYCDPFTHKGGTS